MTKPITIQHLRDKTAKGEVFSMLTAYDASIARICEDVGIDVLLVGDSLGNVVQGHDTTVPVSVDDIIYHAQAVARGAPHTLRMLDMPFLSYTDEREAVMNAKRLMQDGFGHIVKLEVSEANLSTVRFLVEQQVPVCAHIGLTPQTIHKLGKFKTIGKTKAESEVLYDLAHKFEQVGVDALLLECVPSDVAKIITERANIPVIGIGCGHHTNGQVLVVNDILGTSGYIPFFAKNYLTDTNSIKEAINTYHQDVIRRRFPE